MFTLPEKLLTRLELRYRRLSLYYIQCTHRTEILVQCIFSWFGGISSIPFCLQAIIRLVAYKAGKRAPVKLGDQNDISISSSR